MTGSKKEFKNKRIIESSHYLSVIGDVLTPDEIASLTSVSESAVRHWKMKRVGPHVETVKRLGELAACVKFLDKKLGFTSDESRAYLTTTYLDPETCEPTSILEQFQEGNTPLVIQKAIEWSVNGNFFD